MNATGQELLDDWEKTGDLQSPAERIVFDVTGPRW
jgi:hypothetical protein